MKLFGVPLLVGLGILGVVTVAASALLRRRGKTAVPRSRIALGLSRASGAVQAVAKSPFVWLLVTLWLAFLSTYDTVGFHPQRVNDTQNYEELLEPGAFSNVFVHHRTLGYPLFLKLAGWERSDLRNVPVAHAVFFGFAVMVFWFGVRSYTGSGWLAFCAAAPLAWSPLLRVIQRVQPDFLGAASSVVVLGLLMLLAARRSRSPLLWTLVAGVAFTAYQIRPGNVFLIGFLPLAAVVLWAAKHGAKDPLLRRFAIASLIAALGPFALYGAARWIEVGHFGLVSFGGFQIIGVTSPMLDDELVAELPGDLRPFAAAILEEKERRGLQVYTAGSPLEYWFGHYNTHVWRIAVPIARELYEAEGAPRAGLITTNERFTALSHAIIARRPLLYADWVARSFGAATATALREPWVSYPLAISLAALVVLALRRRSLSDSRSYLVPLIGLLIVAATYYAIHILLVVAVEATIERYYVATVVFLPSALCALAAGLWRSALASTREFSRD